MPDGSQEALRRLEPREPTTTVLPSPAVPDPVGDENSPPPQEQPAIVVDQLGSSEVGKLRAEAESLRTDLARSSEAREVAETRLRQLDEQREMDWGEFTQVPYR